MLCLALAVPNAVEAGAPSVLYGKSRVVTTNETRISRPVGGPEAAASAHSVCQRGGRLAEAAFGDRSEASRVRSNDVCCPSAN